MIKKSKKLCIGHMLLMIGADIVGTFFKKKFAENKPKRA